MTHLSELAIDRLLASEPRAAEARALLAHAEACPGCGALLADARRGQAAFARARPALRIPRRRVASTAGALAMLAACAAVAAVVLAWPPSPARDSERTKGTAIVGFYVAHGAQVRRGALHEVVVPGDRIELFTTTSEPAWFAAIAEDAAGARSVYLAPRALAPGHEAVVPAAIELDRQLGPQTVSGVFCAAAFEPRAIDLRAPPAGCTIDRFSLIVVAR